MIFLLYKTRLKCLIRHKENMFWSFMFPIILSTCFFFAFNNLWSMNSFESIPIAYVNESTGYDPLKDTISKAMMNEDTPIFSAIYCNKDEASTLLEDGNIDAYIVDSEDPKLYIKQNGINQTIMKSFLDNYRSVSATVVSLLEDNPAALTEGLIENIMETKSFMKEQTNGRKPNAILIYFYSLLAFTCIMSAHWGLDEVFNIQANQSPRGARVNVSPINKMKLFLCNLFAAYTIQCGSILLLIGYLSTVLDVDFAGQWHLIILICFLGSLSGLFLGGAVGVYLKKSAATKDAILTALMMIGGFLSGMMVIDIKYLIAKHIPILGYLNPTNLITDALYSLYYYDNYDRYILNALILSAFTILLGVAVYLGVRRKDYANI